jgi:hypothetical protein
VYFVLAILKPWPLVFVQSTVLALTVQRMPSDDQAVPLRTLVSAVTSNVSWLRRSVLACPLVPISAKPGSPTVLGPAGAGIALEAHSSSWGATLGEWIAMPHEMSPDVVDQNFACELAAPASAGTAASASVAIVAGSRNRDTGGSLLGGGHDDLPTWPVRASLRRRLICVPRFTVSMAMTTDTLVRRLATLNLTLMIGFPLLIAGAVAHLRALEIVGAALIGLLALEMVVLAPVALARREARRRAT